MPDNVASTRIVILGAGKSGTSARFHCVCQSAERHYGISFGRLFEPKTQDQLEAFEAHHAIAKVLAERLRGFPQPEAALSSFGRRLMIVRDPRDTVVSRLLWLVATRIDSAPPPAADAFMAALKEKEKDSNSWSVLALYDLAAPVVGFGHGYAAKARDLAYLPIEMLRRFPGFHRVRYEDFIDRQWHMTEAYLGFPLLPDFVLPERQAKILRTGASGGWRNWFLPEDLTYFAMSQSGALNALGYAMEAPKRQSAVDPAGASDYIKRVRADISRLGAPGKA